MDDAVLAEVLGRSALDTPTSETSPTIAGIPLDRDL
jgi:hypothetical protein